MTRTRSSSSRKLNEGFNPDRLSLTKQEILNFCERVLVKLNKKPVENARHIFAMNAVKTSVSWTDEDSLKIIWGEILKWTFELLYENAMAQGKKEDDNWSYVMEQLKKPEQM